VEPSGAAFVPQRRWMQQRTPTWLHEDHQRARVDLGQNLHRSQKLGEDLENQRLIVM